MTTIAIHDTAKAATVTATTEMVVITCPECSGFYCITKLYQEEARKLGLFRLCWKCPYCGTSRGYGENETDRLQKRVTELACDAKRAENDRDWYQNRNDQLRQTNKRLERQRNGMKGALVATQNRVKHGVCPCCNRHFRELERHMKTEHPAYGSEPAANS